jgi:hypothetical protein
LKNKLWIKIYFKSINVITIKLKSRKIYENNVKLQDYNNFKNKIDLQYIVHENEIQSISIRLFRESVKFSKFVINIKLFY